MFLLFLFSIDQVSGSSRYLLHLPFQEKEKKKEKLANRHHLSSILDGSLKLTARKVVENHQKYKAGTRGTAPFRSQKRDWSVLFVRFL